MRFSRCAIVRARGIHEDYFLDAVGGGSETPKVPRCSCRAFRMNCALKNDHEHVMVILASSLVDHSASACLPFAFTRADIRNRA
jgi:hypothetical protein